MAGEVIRSRGITGSLNIGWTGEETPNGAWIGPHVSCGILRSPQFEKHVHVVFRFLIPTRCIRLDFNAQIGITSKEFL